MKSKQAEFSREPHEQLAARRIHDQIVQVLAEAWIVWLQSLSD